VASVYHKDSTYKLIRNGFMVYVFGKTDLQHKFHHIVIGIYSHEQEQDFDHLYENLIKYSSKIDLEFDPDYIMQDACQASYNSANSYFNATILMCYFHVMQNIKKKMSSFNNKLQDQIKLEIHNIHMSKTKVKCYELMNEMLQKYKDTHKEFVTYLTNQWFKGDFKRWKIHESPPGYAATNSSIEGYNNKIKRIFTKRRRLSVYAFVLKLVKIIQTECTNRKVFHLNAQPSKKWIEKAGKIKNKNSFKRLINMNIQMVKESK
jgi:hypothetical protein